MHLFTRELKQVGPGCNAIHGNVLAFLGLVIGVI